MFVYAWEYRVRPSSVETFLEHYSPTGSWVELFRQAPGYVGTQLLRDQADPNRFVTVDTWQSLDSHAAFRRKFSAEFQALDDLCETLTESEVHLGDFEPLLGDEVGAA